jgi:two-component system, OmpR family, KDP operon response regulator KdpE
VVDDEKQIRRAVKGALSALDGSTFEAGIGTDGLVLAAAQRPDLVVLDLGLPDMEGIEVCRELRSWTNVPVLVLSAREDAREKAALLDAGADDYGAGALAALDAALVIRLTRAMGVRVLEAGLVTVIELPAAPVSDR